VRRKALGDIGLAAVLAGWPLHAASIFTRALEAGHWPLGNMYEYSTGIAFIVVTVCVVLMIRARMRLVGLPAMILVIALLGIAYMLYVPPFSSCPPSPAAGSAFRCPRHRVPAGFPGFH